MCGDCILGWQWPGWHSWPIQCLQVSADYRSAQNRETPVCTSPHPTFSLKGWIFHLFLLQCNIENVDQFHSDMQTSLRSVLKGFFREHSPPVLLWYRATLPLASPAKRKDGECLRQRTGQLSRFTKISRHWTAVSMLLYTWMLWRQGDTLYWKVKYYK